MAITVIDIKRKRGDTKRITLTVRDSSKVIVDISLWTGFLLTVNSEKKPIDASNQIEQYAGVLSTDGTDGRVHFIPTGNEPVGKYYYDVQALDSNGEKTTILEGSFEFEQDRTKD